MSPRLALAINNHFIIFVMSIRPFKIDISQEEVARLKTNLQDTRIPAGEVVPNAGDDYGQSSLLKSQSQKTRM